MGGRGSSGSGAGTGGGFRLPTLSGSEKQVSWAKDILTHPYNIMGSYAKAFERQADAFDKGGKGYGDAERQTADAYKAAQKRYAQEVKSLGKMGDLLWQSSGGMRLECDSHKTALRRDCETEESK